MEIKVIQHAAVNYYCLSDLSNPFIQNEQLIHRYLTDPQRLSALIQWEQENNPDFTLPSLPQPSAPLASSSITLAEWFATQPKSIMRMEGKTYARLFVLLSYISFAYPEQGSLPWYAALANQLEVS